MEFIFFPLYFDEKTLSSYWQMRSNMFTVYTFVILENQNLINSRYNG